VAVLVQAQAVLPLAAWAEQAYLLVVLQMLEAVAVAVAILELQERQPQQLAVLAVTVAAVAVRVLAVTVALAATARSCFITKRRKINGNLCGFIG
jgi:hypothetical protein